MADNPITQVYVDSVYSLVDGSGEELGGRTNHRSTFQSYPDGDIIISTVEIGSGFNQVARLNGSVLTQDRAEPVYNRAGIRIGVRRYWRGHLSGGGHFEFLVVSRGPPDNAESLSLIIKRK